MAINLLPDEIINQIAAGEGIANPSEFVKECVENSIDANSDHVDVQIEDSGLKKIVIKDNGTGMSKEDLLKAPKRHATSKIKSFSDLYSIKTMGFRGEALASIFSVANSKIISKQKDLPKSYEISSQDTSNIKESGSHEGTSIIVEDLFYNTPARKKYLRSKNIEFRSIVDIIYRYAIYYYNIKFTLTHNSKTILNKPIFKTSLDNISYMLGSDLKDKLLYFENSKDGIKIFGYIGNPSQLTYPYVKNQYLYVNSRYVKSKLIRDAIYEGFSTNLMTQRHPFYVLFLEIDPEIIDVNVHPTKIEIRFENELEIFEFVKNSIKDFLQKATLAKPFEERKERDTELSRIKDVEITKTPHNDVQKKQKENPYFEKDTQKHFTLNEDSINYDKSYPSFDEPIKTHEYQNNQLNQNLEESIQTTQNSLAELLKDYKIVGLLNKTYMIIETPQEMFLIDFHACAEKIAFENLINDYNKKSVNTQKLLKPAIIRLDSSEMLTCKENFKLLDNLGFIFEKFGENEILLREVPLNIQNIEQNPNKIKEIISELKANLKYKKQDEEKAQILARTACRSSIKAGYEMTSPEMKKLIEELKTIKEPFYCPHGRPTMLRFTYTELEKKFKRIV
mgnify:CR=1 FL=1